MDFSLILASGIMVVRNWARLITSPYETMRDLARKADWLEVSWIFFIVGCYFVGANYIRFGTGHWLVPIQAALRSFAVFFCSWGLFAGLIWVLGKIFHTKVKNYSTVAYMSAYALLPSLLWFAITALLYFLFPPPRYFTTLGASFSLLFLVFSVSLFVWRVILLYLTIRFALQVRFMTILIVMFVCGMFLAPYVILGYRLTLFRVPFL